MAAAHPPTTVLAIADLYGIAGRRTELLAALGAAERAAAGQPGCVRYGFAETLGEPDRFVLVSERHDREAMERHYASSGFTEFQQALNGLLARPSEMVVHMVAETVRPVASGPMDPRDAD